MGRLKSAIYRRRYGGQRTPWVAVARRAQPGVPGNSEPPGTVCIVETPWAAVRRRLEPEATGDAARYVATWCRGAEGSHALVFPDKQGGRAASEQKEPEIRALSKRGVTCEIYVHKYITCVLFVYYMQYG